MGTCYYAVKKKPSLYNRTIHIGKSSAGWLFLFRDNEEFHTYPQFKKWLENEDFEIGRESVLSFLEMDLKISFDDFLNGAKEVKERVVQGFVYSASCALYSYLNELFRKI